MDVREFFKRLDNKNAEYFSDYLRNLQLRNLSENSCEVKLWKVYAFLIWFGFRDAKTATPGDVENFYLERKQTRSPITAYGDLSEVGLFYRWLCPDRKMVTFKPQRPRMDIPPEKILTSEYVRRLLEKCENQRDRALVAVAWDSAVRVSELLDTNIGHVHLDQYGAVLSVNGKTGRRNVRLVSSIPDLQAWLNIHPMRDNPDAPIFVTSYRRGTVGGKRLGARRVENIFKRLGDLAGCPKACNPHAFRHGRLTVRGKDLTEAELRLYAGWSKKSSMASVYVHLSGRDIDNKILKVDGVKTEEEKIPDPMTTLKCPRCGKPNPPDGIYCGACSMVLTDKAADIQQKLRKIRDEDYDQIIEWAQEKKTAIGSEGK